MTKSSDEWAKKKTDDLLRGLLADTNPFINDTGLDDALIGRLYRDTIHVGGFALTLPDGQWALLSNGTTKTPSAAGVNYFLGRIQFKRLTGVVRVLALKSNGQPGAGFVAIQGCEKDNQNNFFTHQEDSTPFGAQGCWLIQNYYTTPWQNRVGGTVSMDQAAAASMAAKGITYPQDLVGTRFTRSEKCGMLEATFLFSPEADEISSNTVLSYFETDWHPKNIIHFPEKLAYMAKLKDWGTSYWPIFKANFARAK